MASVAGLARVDVAGLGGPEARRSWGWHQRDHLLSSLSDKWNMTIIYNRNGLQPRSDGLLTCDMAVSFWQRKPCLGSPR